MNARTLTGVFALSQLIAWGPFFYSLPVFVKPIAEDFGWSTEFGIWGLSAALLTAVFAAPLVGSRIDRGQGRAVLIAGHVLGSLCLLILSQVESAAVFLLLCCCLGLSQAACLYDTAFSMIHRHLHERAAKAIVNVTLVAGLSGTLFVPATQYMVEQAGWRGTAMLLAGIALIPACLYLFSLPADRPAIPVEVDEEPHLQKVHWTSSLILLIASFGASTAIFSVVTISFLPLLTDRGMSGLSAAAIFAIVGPSQIAGRVLVWLGSRHFDPFAHGLFVFAIQPVAIAILMFSGTDELWLAGFAILFGINSGLTTILRGTAPALLCSRRVIGRVNGAIGAVGGLSRALAPALFALAAATFSPAVALALLLGVSAFGAVAFAASAHRSRA